MKAAAPSIPWHRGSRWFSPQHRVLCHSPVLSESPSRHPSLTSGTLKGHLYAALATSLVLHVAALLATSGGSPLLLRPTDHARIMLQLPSARQTPERSRDTSIVTPTAVASEPMNTPSQADSPLANAEDQSATPVPSISAYYPRNELSVPARPLAIDDLPQPSEPLDGYAELTLLLGENGSVDAVLTTESSFPPDYFRLLEKFFSNMKFQPGLIDGIPQKSRFVVEVSTSRLPVILESSSLTEERPSPP